MPEARRFPRVVIEDWESEDEDAQDFAPPDSDNDDGSVGSNRDPEFDEEEDGAQGADADGEPDMNNEELWAFLQQHLGPLARDEWIDMCKSHLAFSILVLN